MYTLTRKKLREDMDLSCRNAIEELYAKNIGLIVDALELCQSMRLSKLEESFRQPPNGSFQSLYEQAVEYHKNIRHFVDNSKALQKGMVIRDLSEMRGMVVKGLKGLSRAVYEFGKTDPEESKKILSLINEELEIMEIVRGLANEAIDAENERRAAFAQNGGSPNRPLPHVEAITLLDIGLPPHQE